MAHVCEHQTHWVVIYGKTLVGESEIESEPRWRIGLDQLRHRHLGSSERVLRQSHARQARIGSLDVDQFVPEPSREQLPVVLAGEGVAFRQTRDRPVKAVAEEDDVVGGRQLRRQYLQFHLAVIVVEGQLPNLEGRQLRQALFPMLLQYGRPRLRVGVKPLRGAHRRVTLAIDRHVGQRVEPRRAEEHHERPNQHGPRGRDPDFEPVPHVDEHPGAEQYQEGANRQEIPNELDLERTGDEEIRDHPRQQQYPASGFRPAEWQRGRQGNKGDAGGQHDDRDAVGKQK